MAKQRLQIIVNRFGNAKRIGSLQYRDDRAANQFVLAETFEINRFLDTHPNSSLCRFRLPSNWITSVLPIPEKGERRTPFALPYPCQIVYVIDVDFASMGRMRLDDPRSLLGNQFLQFSQNNKAGHEYFLMTITLNTTTDSVPADQVVKHRGLVEQIWRASYWELSVPSGYTRARPKRGFGELPPPASSKPTHLSLARPSNAPESAPRQMPLPHTKKRPNKRNKSNKSLWRLLWTVLAITLLILFAILKNSHR